MSCIKKILEVKGDKEFIASGEIVIEGGGKYKGFEYLITFVSHGHRCGYIAIPESHPLYKSEEDYPYEYDVHGGVTYFGKSRFEDLTGGIKCDDKWIGFDAAHCYDLECMETSEKYFGESDWVKYRKLNPAPIYSTDSSHRSFAYMEDQCKNLIDQLSATK